MIRLLDIDSDHAFQALAIHMIRQHRVEGEGVLTAVVVVG